jgi:AcrR family transcriptional regulator
VGTRTKAASDLGVTDEQPGRQRPLRADALRNRERLLAAAEAVFAADGIDVPVDVIAERAGVGVGTLYRHFPTKEKLFEAILVERVGAITAEARRRLATEDPSTAFFGFLEYLVGEASRKRDLITAFASAGVEFEVVAAGAKEELGSALGDLLVAAQRAGTVRTDVTAPLVLSLIGATCTAFDQLHEGVAPEELLGVVSDGLRPSSARVPSTPTGGTRGAGRGRASRSPISG